MKRMLYDVSWNVGLNGFGEECTGLGEREKEVLQEEVVPRIENDTEIGRIVKETIVEETNNVRRV